MEGIHIPLGSAATAAATPGVVAPLLTIGQPAPVAMNAISHPVLNNVSS